MTDKLDEHQIEVLRRALITTARPLLGIPYEFGAEWNDLTKLPLTLDCSEMVENVYKINGLTMPDGSQNQFDFTLPAANPLPGDLVFFGRGGNVKQIYHVGLVFDGLNILEARGFQPGAGFETGKVILRFRHLWERYKNFVGYRVHPKLA